MMLGISDNRLFHSVCKKTPAHTNSICREGHEQATTILPVDSPHGRMARLLAPHR